MQCSAGAAGNFLATIDQISSNALKSVMDIDVLGSYNTLKATLPYLVESAEKYKVDGKTRPKAGTGGRIIFVSATLHYSGTPLQSHVSIAKAGVDAMSVSVAIEQGPKGITSNVIAPGPIADTEGMARLSTDDSRKETPRLIPSQRMGYVKEIADATIYLFSDAGNFVNGETIVGEFIFRSLISTSRLADSETSGWRTMAHAEHRQRRHQVSRLLSLRRYGEGGGWYEEVQAVVDIKYHLETLTCKMLRW